MFLSSRHFPRSYSGGDLDDVGADAMGITISPLVGTRPDTGSPHPFCLCEQVL